MNNSKNIKKVSIRHKPGAYTAYRSMNNKIWYALSEYIDNAVQSYLKNKESLLKVDGEKYQFKVEIQIDQDGDFIKIRDNAAGIDSDNFLRAFEPANIPIDITGLSEFGMGLKVASIWFADEYIVKSKALFEEYEREVVFDLIKVVKEGKEDLDVKSLSTDLYNHYTEITLNKLSRNAPKGNPKQLSKIKDHVTSIYRKFLASGDLIIEFNGEKLKFIEPVPLVSPYFEDKQGPKVTWKKNVHFEAGDFKVTGFIGLLKEMSSINSGLSLFRRGRIIQGSHDEKYHPKLICGQSGSPRDKRLYGDLELEGFDVSFEKGSFLQTDNFDIFLDAFRKDLSNKEFNLLKQGDKYVKYKTAESKKELAEKIAKKIDNDVSSGYEFLGKEILLDTEVDQQKEPIKSDASFEYSLDYENVTYELKINLVNDPGDIDFYKIYPFEEIHNVIKINAKANLDHVFFEQYAQSFKKVDDYMHIIQIIKTLIISELIAARQGTLSGGNIRKNFNKLVSR